MLDDIDLNDVALKAGLNSQILLLGNCFNVLIINE